MRKQDISAGPPPTKGKGPLDTDPLSKCDDNPNQEYSEMVELARKSFPSWDPESLRYTVQWLLQEAEAAKAGSWVQGPVGILPVLGVISLDFDGQGAILVNPETMLTAKGKELAQALRLVLGTKVHIGQWVAA